MAVWVMGIFSLTFHREIILLQCRQRICVFPLCKENRKHLIFFKTEKHNVLWSLIPLRNVQQATFFFLQMDIGIKSVMSKYVRSAVWVASMDYTHRVVGRWHQQCVSDLAPLCLPHRTRPTANESGKQVAFVHV